MKKRQKREGKPLVSVVMPAYNSEKTIGEAIESILNQTYKNFEFIIINDGSTDKTLEIIKSYAKKDKRIIVLDNEKNFGIPKTRNIALKKSKGKYIAIQDSDDISLSKRLEKQAEFLERNPNVGVVGSFMEIFDGHKKRGIRKYPEKDKELRKMIFFVCPIGQPAAMIRASVFEKIGLFDERFSQTEDLDLWFRIGNEYKLSNLQEVLIKYRYNPKSSTGTKTKAMEKFAFDIRWKNRKNKNYKFGILAMIYNFLHLISIYLVPSKIKFFLFTKIRD